MRDRRFGAGVYRTLKEKTGEFLKRGFGAQKIAEAASRVDQTQLSRYASPSPAYAESFMPVDVLADLIDESADLTLLSHLADLAGCLLVPLPPTDGAGDAIDEHIIRSAEDYADMVRAIVDAKRDGKVTVAEAPAMLMSIRVLMIELAETAETIKAVAK